MRRNALLISLVAATASFLGASVASADFGIAGQWYSNRGPTVNIPPGKFDGPCPPNTNPVIPFAAPPPATARVPAPCVRHQDPGIPTFMVPPIALSVVPQSGVPAAGQIVTAPTASTAAVVAGAAIRIPPGIFTRAETSMIPVPANPVVQQLDTTFVHVGPRTQRTPTTASAGGQVPGIASQTRLMQPSAWNGPGQVTRTAPNFNNVLTDGGALGTTRRVTYTAGPNGFGGTMGMFLNGFAVVYVVTDLVTAVPGNEILVSPIGTGMGRTLHIGRGYNSTQMRIGNPGIINLNYNVPVACTASIPPSPLGCDLVTGISAPVATLPAATTVNIGFPWTTGHVSVYAKGVLGGIPQTSTLTAEGSDTVSGGVRTIQLVAGGTALRNSPASGLGRAPHLDAITVQVPEPGSTLAFVGALGLIGGLYGARRRLFE